MRISCPSQLAVAVEHNLDLRGTVTRRINDQRTTESIVMRLRLLVLRAQPSLAVLRPAPVPSHPEQGVHDEGDDQEQRSK